MNEKDVFELFPILNAEERCVDMTDTVGRVTSIDDLNTCLVVFVDDCRSLWWRFETVRTDRRNRTTLAVKTAAKNSDSVELRVVTFCVLLGS